MRIPYQRIDDIIGIGGGDQDILGLPCAYATLGHETVERIIEAEEVEIDNLTYYSVIAQDHEEDFCFRCLQLLEDCTGEKFRGGNR